ncbi:MAG: DUF2007-related protein [Bacteroidota bacterium]|jgi:hypothetical protein|nr:DUF2007-related protein [Bacteroidota bacterium]
MDTNEENRPIEIFAGNIFEAGMVKSLLENAGIKAYLKDENLGTVAPWWAAGGGAGAVKVVISNLDFERAKVIVEEYYNNIKDK